MGGGRGGGGEEEGMRLTSSITANGPLVNPALTRHLSSQVGDRPCVVTNRVASAQW